MELLTSLPPDLAVFADPSVRGPAPLLRPPDGDASLATAATPFELCLALLTGGPAGGESWPATGKELPGLPLDSAADDPAPALDPAVLLAFVPTAPADLAQSRLPMGELPTSIPRSSNGGAPTLPQATSALQLQPPPSAEIAATDAGVPQTAELDPLAAFTTVDSAPPALEGGEQQPATAAAKLAPQPSWLEAFTNHGRMQRPPAATAAESRAAAEAATAAPPLAALQPSTATAAVVEATPGTQAGARRVEVQKVFASAVGATESASPPDWLPSAMSHSAATGGAPTAATPASTAPQAPVDLRSPGWQEAFASRLQVLVDTKVGEAHIKLHPPELGAVDVKISLVDDKTFVQLTTATAAARDELAHSLPRLRDLFTGSGLELGGASVHNGRDGYQGGQGGQGQGSGAATAGTRESPFASFSAAGDDRPALVPRRSLGRIDIFA